jgi:AbrB family looped-hinge helix DNA binding protein
MVTAKLTNKGQITVPRSVREHLGLQSGDEVEFVAEPGSYRIQKRSEPVRSFREYVGYLEDLAGRDSDDVLRELRGE